MSDLLLKYTEKQKDCIFKLFNTNAQEVKKNVQRLSEWMKAQPYFSTPANDAFIERVLLTQRFNVEDAKSKLTGYYVCRTVLPQYYIGNPSSLEMAEATKYFSYTVLPTLTEDLGRVIIFQINDNCDSDKFDPIMFLTYCVCLVEIRAREDYFYKEVHVYDLKNAKFSLVTKCNPNLIKHFHFMIEKLNDMTIQEFNLLNVPNFLASLISLIRSFLKPRLQEAMVIHKDCKSLHKCIPKENLPKEYGGTAESIKEIEAMWKKKFLEYNEIAEQTKHMYIKMDLLPEKLKIDDHFGVHGNFRKLDLD